MGMTFSELLAQDDDFNLANGTFCLMVQPYDGWFDASQHSSVELPVVLVWHAKGIIENGFFQKFFNGPWNGDHTYMKTIDAHRQIGHDSAVEALTRAIAAFPNSEPPDDYEEKRAAFLDLPDEEQDIIWDLYWGGPNDKTTETLVAAYIRSHQAELAHLNGRVS